MPLSVSQPHAAAWNRLLAEVAADRVDSLGARESIRQLGPLGVLVRAWVHAQRRELTAARDDLATALQTAGDSAVVLLITGMLAMVLREPGVALARLRAAVRRNPDAADKALEFELHVTRRVTWLRDLREAAERALHEVPRLAQQAHETLSQLFAEAALFDTALHEAEAALPAAPSIEQLLEHARLAARAWRTDRAAEMVEAALQQAGEGVDVLLPAAEVLLTIGAFEQAEELLRLAIGRDGANACALSRLAELSLWHGDDAAADILARRALERDPSCVAALRTRGICEFHGQRSHAALDWFDRALAAVPQDTETLIWRARTRFLLDEPLEAHRDLDEASKLGRGSVIGAELVRFEYEAARTRRRGPVRAEERTGLRRQFVEPTLGFLRLIRPDAGAVLRSEDGEAQHALFSAGLDALGANYSSLTTLCRNGHLQRVSVSFIRAEALRALQTIRVLPLAEVRAQLEHVVARYPESSLPLCYMGELYVWLGDATAARQWLRRAIAHTRTTRWAYIGLSACELLDSRYQNALDMLALGVERMANTTGPAVYPYRAEALRRLGRFAEARADLERALDSNPTRLGTWINLGLLEAEVGDAPAQARAVEEVRRRAAGLIADAAEEIGEAAWLDGDALPSTAVQRRLLDHMLVMLRGNRATGLITYFRKDGSLHVLSPIDTDLAKFDQWDLQTSWSLIELLSPAHRQAR